MFACPRLPLAVILMLVTLRLAAGWHFYNEGVKKLEPGFTSAGFLQGAKGPLKPVFAAMNPGPHGAYAELTAPAQYGSRDPEAAAELAAWRADYAKRAKAAVDKGKPVPGDYSEHAPYAGWLERIASDWEAGRVRFARLPGVTEEQVVEAERLAQSNLDGFVYYLHGQGEAIDELKHEAWRLEQLKKKAGKETKVPYQQALIDQNASDVRRTALTWANAATDIEEAYIEDVTAHIKATGDGLPGATRIASALGDRGPLKWIDRTVAAVVLGSGILLFLGFLTPFAAIMAAGFLLSVMATQPPWVAGADTTYFFYQLVEVISLVLLAVVGAGQWAGLDGLYDRACARERTPLTLGSPERPTSVAA